MMNKTIRVMSLLAVTSFVQTAIASAQPNWSGFYAGLNADAQFNHVYLHSYHAAFMDINGTCNTTDNSSRFSPGIQLGYAHQFHNHVIWGVEGSFNYNTNQATRLNCTCPFNSGVSDSFTFYNRSQGTLVGRIGYELRNNRLLPFIIGGGSLSDLGLKYTNENGDRYSTHSTKAGWLVGGGVEWRLAAAWSIRAAYYYISYNKIKMPITTIYGLTDPAGGAHAALNENNAVLSVNYWFY